MNYAVKVNGTGRFIKWCNKNWFETDETPMYIFSKKEAEDVINQLKKHYIFKASIVSQDGIEEDMSTPIKKMEFTPNVPEGLFNKKIKF